MFSGILGDQLGGRESLRILAAVLHHFRSGLRLRVELAVAAGLPLHRRAGHWRLVGAGAGVHRRDRSRALARTAGRLVPDQHRDRNPGRVSQQLPDRVGRLRHERVALAAGHRCRSRRLVPDHAVRHSAKRALAGDAVSHSRSAPGAGKAGLGRSSRRAGRDRRLGARAKTRPTPSRSSSASIGFRSISRLPLRPSTSWPESTPSCIT